MRSDCMETMLEVHRLSELQGVGRPYYFFVKLYSSHLENKAI